MAGTSCVIEDIFSLYGEELRAVEEELLKLFQSSAFVLPSIGLYIVKSGGKRLRPLFLIVSAELCGYKGPARARLGAIIEAIHTASLLHDDVIDQAEMRRGQKAAHHIWGNQTVILVGDFLYSNALRMAVAEKSQLIMEALAEATTRMTEGELLQLSKISDPEITEDEYLEIISAKTGALISAACRVGAILGGMPEEKQNALGDFGLKTGIAFQMVDDILDYRADEETFGKNLGKDLEEGKVTMPMIELLRVCDEGQRKRLKEIITSGNGSSEMDYILELFRRYNIIERSLEKAVSIVEEAKACLEVFVSNEAKEHLLCLAEYSLYRRY
ncbi:MAG: polyprenyl synthetase family protein [Nitrospirae bacterium]|nr:MAG: polyprenyl synthetase family protein [Nitrospirota bacterium]